MVKLTEGVKTTVYYKGEGDARDIIPLKLPHKHVLAIDLSKLSTSKERAAMEAASTEYQKYVSELMSHVLSFDEWLKRTGTIVGPVSYRRFDPDQLTQ